MNLKSRPAELTPAERRAYAALHRDTPIDDAEEERTVRGLRARGVFGPRAVTQRASRTWWRATAIVSAAAAGIVAVLQSTRLQPAVQDDNRARDTATRGDTHASSTAPQRPASAGLDQRQQEKTSLLVWY